MIHLAGFFALWEMFKLAIGPEELLTQSKNPGSIIGAMAILCGIPYMAWGVWLLFSHIYPALILWSICFVSLYFHHNQRAWYSLVARIDGFICVVVLVLLFLGRIQ